MKGITKNNVQQYIQELFPNEKCTLLEHKKIKSVMGLLQKDFGGLQDCTLTSITALFQYYTKQNIWKLYGEVEQAAKKRGYKENIGTNPLAVRFIILELLKHYNLKKSVYSAYLKNITFTFNSLKKLINHNIPVVLNINTDGRGYYINHTVLIVGYEEYVTDKNHKIQLLQVQDNWSVQTAYVDFAKLHSICSINYMI